MFKKIVVTLFILCSSSYAIDDLQYHSDKENSFSKILSYKKIQLQENISLKLNLPCMLILVDDRFQTDEPEYLLKTKNPDKVFLSLSYTF